MPESYSWLRGEVEFNSGLNRNPMVISKFTGPLILMISLPGLFKMCYLHKEWPDDMGGCPSPAKELTLRPAVAPANVCKAPREAMGLTELLLLELGEDPAIRNPQVKLRPTRHLPSYANRNQSPRATLLKYSLLKRFSVTNFDNCPCWTESNDGYKKFKNMSFLLSQRMAFKNLLFIN